LVFPVDGHGLFFRKELVACADRSILPWESRFGLPVDEGFVTLVCEFG